MKEGSADKVRKQAYDAFVAIDQAKIEKAKLEPNAFLSYSKI